MFAVTERFAASVTPALDTVNFAAQAPADSGIPSNLPATDSNNYSLCNIKERFFETVSSVKKFVKKFKKTQKILSRADLFSSSDLKLDALKIISAATLPFILLELYRTGKSVCEVSLGVSIKDPISEKAAIIGHIALKIGKNVYDAADSTIELIKSTVKTDDAAKKAISSISSSISVAKIISATLLPFILLDMCSNIEKIYKIVMDKAIVEVKEKLSRAADHALSIIDNCVDITQIIAYFISNTLLATVTGFLSAINIVIVAKNLYDSAVFYRKIKERNFSVIDTSNYDFKKNLRPSEKVKCILRVTGEKEKEVLTAEIKKKLTKRSQSNNAMDTEKIDQMAQNILEKISPEKIEAVEAVQKTTKLRSIQIITCHALKGVVSAINIAASAILLAAPPLAPVSYGLLGVSSLISLSGFLFDSFAGLQWENAVVNVVKRIIDKEWKSHQNMHLTHSQTNT